jgi:hypothetical protein
MAGDVAGWMASLHVGYRAARRGAQEAADHRPSERGILLAAFAEPEGHGHRADDHGEGEREHVRQPDVRSSGTSDAGAPWMRRARQEVLAGSEWRKGSKAMW